MNGVAFLSEGKIRGIGSPEKILHEFSDIFSPPNLEHADKHDKNKVGSTTENVIEVEHLVKAFGTFHAVDDISFTVRKGEIFGFLGANGAGKTNCYAHAHRTQPAHKWDRKGCGIRHPDRL